MRYLEQRCWSDGDRHWYDAPLGGYYMREGQPGMFNESGRPVAGFELLKVASKAEFVALIRGVVMAEPGRLP